MWPFPLNAEERETLPTHAELCNECHAKAPLPDRRPEPGHGKERA